MWITRRPVPRRAREELSLSIVDNINVIVEIPGAAAPPSECFCNVGAGVTELGAVHIILYNARKGGGV